MEVHTYLPYHLPYSPTYLPTLHTYLASEPPSSRERRVTSHLLLPIVPHPPSPSPPPQVPPLPPQFQSPPGCVPSSDEIDRLYLSIWSRSFFWR